MILERCLTVDKEGKKVCSNFDRIVRELRNEGKAEGKVEGRSEGLLEGIQVEKLNTIQRLCELKAEISLIASATALSVQQVHDVIVQHQFMV